jgi:hypothetical protein
MSIVLAAEYRVKDYARWWSIVEKTPAELRTLGAHHLVVYRALDDGDRIFSTLGVRSREPLRALLGSRQMMEWFDLAGVEDIPSLFAGDVLEKLDLTEFTGRPGAVIVAGVVRLDDPARWLGGVHAAADQLRASGVTRVWTYRAFDDDQELMILQEIETERQARDWITHGGKVAEWMAGAGIGAYPPLFVGRLAQVLAVER